MGPIWDQFYFDMMEDDEEPIQQCGYTDQLVTAMKEHSVEESLLVL